MKTLQSLEVNHNKKTVKAVFNFSSLELPYKKLSEINVLMGNFYNPKYNSDHNRLFCEFELLNLRNEILNELLTN